MSDNTYTLLVIGGMLVVYVVAMYVWVVLI